MDLFEVPAISFRLLCGLLIRWHASTTDYVRPSDSTLMVGMAVPDKRPLLSNKIAQKGLALRLETSIAVGVMTSHQAC
jgi:hypothetical protein